MKKSLVSIAAVLTVLSLFSMSGWGRTATAATCTTIADGGLTDSSGNPLVLGYDQFGYNSQAHMFNGTYDSSDRTLDGTYWGSTGDYVDDHLSMKWSDDWLSNKDCTGEGKLERGTSGISMGWLTNHVQGDYLDGGDVVHYTDFVKIVWVGPDGDLWGEYTIIQENYNDPTGRSHFKAAQPGLGLNNHWTTIAVSARSLRRHGGFHRAR